MLKINGVSNNRFNPETDYGYALDFSGDLWLFPKDSNGGIWFDGDDTECPVAYDNAGKINIDFGPFTRFTGTATIGNG